MRLKQGGAVLALVALGAAGLALAGVRPATAQQEIGEHQVLICHHVEGLGNTGNGYNLIVVDKDSIANIPNGHDTHELDLIPPFAAGATSGPPGPPKAWDAYPGKGDFSLIGTNCAVPDTTTTTTTGPPPPPPPPPTTTTTTTETTTTTPPPPPPPSTTTETTTTTTTTPPPTTTTQPTTTTTTTTTATPPAAAPTPKPKPPVKAKPKPKPKPKKPSNAPPKMPPLCPVGEPFTGACAPQGSG